MLDVYNILPHVTSLPLPFRIIGHLLRIVWMVLTTIYAIPPYLVWTFLVFPLRFFYLDFYWMIEGFLFSGLLAIISSWLITGQYQIIETGDDINYILDENVLLIANHQSTADVPALMDLMHSKANLSKRVMWIIDSTFKYTHFGLVSNLRGDFFITQGKDARDSTLQQLRSHLRSTFHTIPRKWLVLFPEGGFLRKRKLASQRYAKKQNLPVLENITLPRVGAMQVILEEMAERKTVANNNSINNDPKFKYVVDVTIAYPKGRPLDIHGIGIGYWPPCHILMHYRIYPANKIPVDNKGLTDWMNELYIEKEKMLGNYYKHGVLLSMTDQQKRDFPRIGARQISPDLLGDLLYHTFYIVSAYIQYTVISSILRNWW
ncbi:acyl1-likeCoA:lysophosphatidylglycerol:lysophosphatidylglycerol [Octopus vulgaris]|nr:acyl-CoA:lysophosphatidylglycerol acyltransferase 1-like [Octopus sinensis]XP_036368136.1 acyl-CoA:lysophosphatidylglycerol acyltransferase 1-like [Octopus sinensis]XP_036368138.1 acyl-CoA:lysophosphatidylglycerol acyltransferase 1-like [Octopus sinensis]CAI9739071.1 acyl1-likeCoA:lysophosphatidylglycerol:lysophosphatidylglycerol [Octopus vulgaris]